MRENRYWNIGIYLILALLLYMPIFGYQGTLPIRIWDEARLATNAYEMLKNGDFITTYSGGVPDMWNTKPPLMIWCQVFFMKTIGVNELAVRLPSAIAAFTTCIALLFFLKRQFLGLGMGFLTAMVLITSKGYIGHHVVRTGDYDALLTCFTTVYLLAFFLFIDCRKNKYLFFFFVFLTLAVLTKGVSGLLFLPAIAIYIIWKKQLTSLLKNKQLYIGTALFLLMIMGYYLLRELRNPGYIQAVCENELWGRYLVVSEGNGAPFWFYLEKLMKHRFAAWFYLFPIGVLIGLFNRDRSTKEFSIFALIALFTYFLVISISKTKLDWYDAPMYPFLAYFVALPIKYGCDIIGKLKLRKSVIISLSILLVFFIFKNPYKEIFHRTYQPTDKGIYQIGNYLKKAVNKQIDIHNQCLIYEGYNLQNIFYINILKEKGINIRLKQKESLIKGDIVIICQKQTLDFVKEDYNVVEIGRFDNVITFRILEKKCISII